MFTLTTTQGVWHQCHSVETRNAAFAHLLFEQVLDIDIEPSCTHTAKGFLIEFVADAAERDAAIEEATRRVGGIA